MCKTHRLHGVRPTALARLEEAPHLGQIIQERYALIDLIGGGGMGIVYRARQLTIGRDVALKLLNTSFATKPDVKKRFKREAQVLAELNSDYAVKIIDFGFVQQGPLAQSPFMVMEAVEGSDLAARLALGPLPPADALLVLEQVGDALDEAHRKGIVHRDIKPGNLLLTNHNGAPRLKVIDFGIARIDQGELTGTAHTLGTPSYMAPELWMTGENRPEIDNRVDIYAMGVLLHYMLSGHKPFNGAMLAMSAAHCYAPRPPLAPHLARYQPVVHRAMAIDPAERYPTVSAMADAFRMVFLSGAAGVREPTTLLDTLDGTMRVPVVDDTAPSDPSALSSTTPSSSLLAGTELLPGARPAEHRSIIPPVVRQSERTPPPPPEGPRQTVTLPDDSAGPEREPSYSHHITGVIDSIDIQPRRFPTWALAGLGAFLTLAVVVVGYVMWEDPPDPKAPGASGSAAAGAPSDTPPAPTPGRTTDEHPSAGPEVAVGPDEEPKDDTSGEGARVVEGALVAGAEEGGDPGDALPVPPEADPVDPSAGATPTPMPSPVDTAAAHKSKRGAGTSTPGAGTSTPGAGTSTTAAGASKRAAGAKIAADAKIAEGAKKPPAGARKAHTGKAKPVEKPAEKVAEKAVVQDPRPAEVDQESPGRTSGPGVAGRPSDSGGGALDSLRPATTTPPPPPPPKTLPADVKDRIDGLAGLVERRARHCQCDEAREEYDRLVTLVNQHDAAAEVDVKSLLDRYVTPCRPGTSSGEIRSCNAGEGLKR